MLITSTPPPSLSNPMQVLSPLPRHSLAPVLSRIKLTLNSTISSLARSSLNMARVAPRPSHWTEVPHAPHPTPPRPLHSPLPATPLPPPPILHCAISHRRKTLRRRSQTSRLHMGTAGRLPHSRVKTRRRNRNLRGPFCFPKVHLSFSADIEFSRG